MRLKTPVLLRQVINHLKLLQIDSKKERDKIIVLCEARTGSGLLSTLLNSIKGIFIGGEILNPNVGTGLWRWASKKTAFRHISNSLKIGKGEYCGIKLHYSHFTAFDIKTNELVKEYNDSKFILLYRSNITNQFISSRITKKTRLFGTKDNPVMIKERIKIDIDQFELYCERRIREIKEMKDQLIKNQADFLELKYEDLASSPQDCFNKLIFPFLKIQPQQVSTDLKKQNQLPKSELIENFDSVEPVLLKYSNFNF